MDIQLTVLEKGVLLPVKARAGGKANRITGTHNGSLKIEVTAAPEKGKANRALRKLLGKLLGVPISSVEIQSGETAPRKTFLIHGLEASEVARRLDAAVKENA